jgi:hypothetical protein
MVFAQHGRQKFSHKQQVTLHQPHRNGCCNGGKRPDAGSVADGLFAPFLILLCFERSIRVVWPVFRVMGWGRRDWRRLCGLRLCRRRPQCTLVSVVLPDEVLADSIPDGDRILILEDVAELYIKKPHVISAEAQLDTHKSQIGFADLLKAALRHRPDRIIVGEIRGPEARVFLDALNTGHRGSITTIHANSATDALRRLAQLAMRGSGGGVPLHDVEEECGRSIDVIVQVMNRDGWRHVTEIRVAASDQIIT